MIMKGLLPPRLTVFYIRYIRSEHGRWTGISKINVRRHASDVHAGSSQSMHFKVETCKGSDMGGNKFNYNDCKMS
jgi:hypothetical protein